MTTEAEPRASGPFSYSATLIVLSLLVFTLFLVVLSIPLGLYTVFVGNLSTQFHYSSFVLTYLFVGPLPAVLPFEVPVGGVFAFLCLVYALMLLLAAMQGARPLAAMKDSLHVGVAALFRSPLLLTILSIGFMVFTTTWVSYATEATGAPIGNPFRNVDPLFELTSLTLAPLREEIGFRVLLIGLVAMVLCIGRPVRQALKALWRPSVAYEGQPVRGATIPIILIALAISSVTFGYSHVVGWGWGKFPEAAYAGVILGYLYVRFGLHVAVLVHWGQDYFTSVYAFFGQAAFGVNWNSATTEFFGQYVIDFDMLFLFGVASFLVVTYAVTISLVRRRAKKPAFDLIDKPPTRGVQVED